MENAIDIQSLGVEYGTANNGRLVALSGMDLALCRTEIVALMGPSGCGKSSLINVLAGFIRPTHGVVRADGQEVKGPDASRSVVFQKHALFPWLRVTENIMFGLRYQPIGQSEREKRVHELLHMIGLEEFGDRYPKELSVGMEQRVGLARALAMNPKILLMDEPFGALDLETRTRMQRLLITSWQRYQPTILIVTQDIDEAMTLADRIVIMTRRPGRILDTVGVPLARPRSEEQIALPEYTSARLQVVRALQRAMAE